MKIVLLGDVGSTGGFHLGDEAMAEAVVAELGARTPLSVVAVSGDPVDTAERYGWEVVPRIGFSADGDEQSEARLDRVLAAASGDPHALPWSDPAWHVIHAVAACDAVVISGGGNLNSSWPEHVYERAALASLSALFGKRHVVTGQTVGPHLTRRHGEIVGGILTSAAAVGAREAATYETALQLGVPPERLVQTVDDAAYLAGEGDREALSQPYVAATFSPHGGLLDHDRYVTGIAALLDDVHRATGYPVVLVPHQGTAHDGELTGDLAMHQSIVDACSSAPVTALGVVSSRRAVRVTQDAALVISSRYHPVVFAMAGSVPAIGLGVDVYTSTKIRGALSNYGMGDYALSVASLTDGGALAAAEDLRERATEIRSHLERVNEVRRHENAAWWDTAVGALTTGDVAAHGRLREVEEFAGSSWTATAHVLRSWSDAISTRIVGSALASAAVYDEAHVQARVDELELEAAALSSRLADALDEIETLRISARAAHELLSTELRPLVQWSRDLPTVRALEAERDALYGTRTFRYLRGPRELYRKLRS